MSAGAQNAPARVALLNAYFCELPGRWYGRSYEAPDPGEWVVPCGIFMAETRGQAKRMFIRDEPAAEPDEFVDVRTRLLCRRIQGELGRTDHGALWFRLHEVQDHGGKPCDCPEVTWDEATGEWVDTASDGSSSDAPSPEEAE